MEASRLGWPIQIPGPLLFRAAPPTVTRKEKTLVICLLPFKNETFYEMTHFMTSHQSVFKGDNSHISHGLSAPSPTFVLSAVPFDVRRLQACREISKMDNLRNCSELIEGTS